MDEKSLRADTSKRHGKRFSPNVLSCVNSKIELQRYIRMASNPKVNKYVSYQPHKSKKDSKKIAAMWALGAKKSDNYNRTIELNGKVIDNIAVVDHDNLWECSMGWQIDATFWNQGIMTKAATAVFDHLFNTVCLYRISAKHNTRAHRFGQSDGKVRNAKRKRVPSILL